MLRYMLDTDIVVYAIRNRPDEIRKALEAHYGQVCISTVTLMELVYGAKKSMSPQSSMDDIQGLVGRLDVLPYDSGAAVHSGEIRSKLAKLGKPIGPYDLMIAGHARSLGYTLVTNNTREFQRVDGLLLANWYH